MHRLVGPLARSDDGGKTWSAPLDVPPNWHETANTPSIHQLVDPQGVARLVVFADGLDWRRGGKPPYPMHQAVSDDDGKTWSPMKPNGLQGEVPPKSILSFDDGKRLVLWSDLPGYVTQSESHDGGLTWNPQRQILRIPDRWGQPSVIRSPDGKQLLMLLRENSHRNHSLYSVSDDDAQTWSEPRELPAALTGDRHVVRYAPDGRLVVGMRDMAKTSPTYGHYVVWVGHYEDIIHRREGQYRIKVLHNANRTDQTAPGEGNTDCGYSDLEVLPDGTILATTYVKYAPGPEKNSVVSVRFNLAETDALLPPKNTTWGAKSRTIRYEYRLMNPTSKPATGIVVNVPLPLVSPRQKIEYLHLPKSRPYQLVTDRHGQHLVRYTLDRLESGEWVDLGYVVGMTLKNIHWDASKLSLPETAPVLTPKARELYLKSETNYSMDNDVMRNAAASLVEGATNDYEKLVRIHDFVTNSIRYVRDGHWDPAHVVLTRGTGSCSEYNYVLSGLCRLAGLPTRCVGGSSNGHRDLPTTDTVYHRWTEVFLEGYGWFPADCSRDANPIRGDRSHFGRVYIDALVWCRQAGGEDDSLGWDYRAKAHVQGDDPGIRENHRTRWFEFQEEEDVEAAYRWFLDGSGSLPEADLLECALLRWESAKVENRREMIQALAGAGRNECLWRAAIVPDPLRTTCIRQLCQSPELAETVLEESRDLYGYRNWFRSHETRLVPVGDGRFELSQRAASAKTPTTTASSSQIWMDLVPEVVSRAQESAGINDGKTVVVMPVTDQTVAGLGKERESILAALKHRFSEQLGIKVVDEVRFNKWMEQRGPGIGQYWILANGGCDEMPSDLAADIVLAPVCITSKGKDSVLYHLELKALELSNCKYTKAVARVRRMGEKQASTDRGVLVAGGDTVLARWEHDLVARHGYDWPLAGVKNVLESADGALCNLECCVSMRGAPTDKGEHCPFYYRARPEMLRCLTSAGIDMVTAANNHGGDYGPVSVADTAKWCSKAGLVCVGNGNSLAEAEAPRLVRIGPVVVGLVGMDATKACFAADAKRPGTNYVAAEGDLRPFAEKVEQIAKWADGRCDLLVLTIHWGKNWVRETQPFQKKMARIAFEHGVDVILGHSAHRLQGIEVIDGKPVVYDMGNLLFDCKLKPEGQRSALFRLELSARGVHKIEVLPVEALEGHVVLANYDEAQETLSDMSDLCSSLGSRLSVEEDIDGRPLGVIRIKEPKVTPRARSDSELACAVFPAEGEEIGATLDGTVVNAEIPESAQKLGSPVEVAPGVELIAFELPSSVEEGGLLHLATWWRVSGTVGRHVELAFHISPGGETPRRGTPWYTRHDAGDWSVPLCRLEKGMVAEDRYPARLAGIPVGASKVYAVVLDTARPEESRTLGEPHLLGEVQIVPRSK